MVIRRFYNTRVNHNGSKRLKGNQSAHAGTCRSCMKTGDVREAAAPSGMSTTRPNRSTSDWSRPNLPSVNGPSSSSISVLPGVLVPHPDRRRSSGVGMKGCEILCGPSSTRMTSSPTDTPADLESGPEQTVFDSSKGP